MKAEPNVTPEQQAIVQQIIGVFNTQEILASHLGIDQSTVSGWLKRGVIPARRQAQIMELSKALVAQGKLPCVVTPEDFFKLRETAQAA